MVLAAVPRRAAIVGAEQPAKRRRGVRGQLAPGLVDGGLDAVNVLNRPTWDNPTTDINSASFGRITGAGGTRTITINARIDF